MRIFLMVLALGLISALSPKSANAGLNPECGYVAVASHTYTAMVSTTNAIGMYAWDFYNESATGTIRCGFSVSVSTIAGNANLGMPVKKGESKSVKGSWIPYCKSEVDGQTSPGVFCFYK